MKIIIIINIINDKSTCRNLNTCKCNCKVCSLVAAVEHKNSQTKFNAFWDMQPVKVAQQHGHCRHYTNRAAAYSTDCSQSRRRLELPVRVTQA